MKKAKNQTNATNTVKLKIIHILHPRYNPKIIGHILKNKKKQVCLYSWDYTINHNENECENENEK